MERTQCPQNSPNVNPQNGRDREEETACVHYHLLSTGRGLGSFQVSKSKEVGRLKGFSKLRHRAAGGSVRAPKS